MSGKGVKDPRETLRRQRGECLDRDMETLLPWPSPGGSSWEQALKMTE